MNREKKKRKSWERDGVGTAATVFVGCVQRCGTNQNEGFHSRTRNNKKRTQGRMSNESAILNSRSKYVKKNKWAMFSTSGSEDPPFLVNF